MTVNDREELESLFLVFCSRIFGDKALQHLHFGLWKDGIPEFDIEFAQEAYAEFLISQIPPEIQSVLDVGCGLGGISMMLSRLGKNVTAITPIRQHHELIEKAALNNVDVLCTRFEEFTCSSRFDMLLFAESFNYFLGSRSPRADIGSFFDTCRQLLHPKGHILFSDMTHKRVLSWIQECPGINLIKKEDITDKVAPTVNWFQKIQERYLRPYHQLLVETIEIQRPQLRSLLEEVLESVPNNDIHDLLRGQLDMNMSSSEYRYIVGLLQIAD